ncbi:uncharacterized protein JN550_008616 [Neoarthrinium moseri]|uniref:uncharacterized protein n=1 Tax=Neoarthrinium moseri TaxID=1658444 RepID=UPI001FDBF6F7|nr:uncharacterized protein JN550_008616 [Neoarthrinium moseri]KAI1865070.1 hypothetical protein JN550_008616 [Neoarthrinium moseri]
MDAAPEYEQPPEYEEEVNGAVGQVMSPGTLVLSNHHVIPASCSNSDPKPLYELSRGVAVLSNATTSVEFSRLDHSVSQSVSGEPTLRVRKRQLYSLEHFRNGYLGKGSRGSPPKKVKRDSGEYGEPCFVEGTTSSESPILFAVRWVKRDGLYEWADYAGKQVAVESIAGGTHTLDVRIELPRQSFDVLVALWCLRIWFDSVQEHNDAKPPIGWTEIKRRIRLANDLPTAL